MHRLMIGLTLLASAATLHAEQVVDDFESGANPNQWGWTNNDGGAYLIQPSGGNPGEWLDSGLPYFSDHPNLTSIPAAGTALKTALASGTLTSASFDFQRLDTSASSGCHPTYTTPSTFSLELMDMHTDPGGAIIEAHLMTGPDSPTAPSSWQNVSFTIPSDSTDAIPDGWELNAPPELNYTWPELMQNIDGIRFFSVNPDDLTYDACWELGADNVVITYGAGDTIFADGFDPAAPVP